MMPEKRFTGEDKIDWEVRKLQAEVDASNRGVPRGATYWVPWVTTAIAVGGFFLQYQESHARRQVAAVQLERAQLEREKVDRAVADANQVLEKAKDDLEDVLKERQTVMQETAGAIKELNDIKTKLAAAATGTAPTSTNQELQAVSNRFDRNLQSQQQLNEQARTRINAIRPIDIRQIRSAQGVESQRD